MEHDFAVLVAPYFQYPNTSSQIYASSLSDKVCLLSWEHKLFLLNQQVVEDVSLSLEQIWNAPTRIERDSKIAYADRMNCLFPYINKMVCDRIPISLKDFEEQLNICKLYIFERSNDEIAVLNAEIQKIEEYTKEQAIRELIKSRKLNEKISAILSYKEFFIKSRGYNMKTNSIICGNSIEEIKNIDSNSVYLILSDIPYGISFLDTWDILHNNTNSSLFRYESSTKTIVSF